MSKQIALTKGYFTIVDDEDFEELNKFKWCYRSPGYAGRRVTISPRNSIIVLLHHAILPRQSGLEIDHINGQKLDNRRENLRNVTHKQNMHNQNLRNEKSSRFKGVCWRKYANAWNAHITNDYKQIFLGRFESELAAAEAYNKAAIELFGEYARLNEVTT